MPYIHLETTSDLPENGKIPDILEALTTELASIPGMDSKSIKSFHSLYSVWVVGEGAPPGFAKCTVEVLTGHQPPELEDICMRLYAVLKREFSEGISEDALALGLEVREMNRSTYRKL